MIFFLENPIKQTNHPLQLHKMPSVGRILVKLKESRYVDTLYKVVVMSDYSMTLVTLIDHTQSDQTV